MNDRRLTQVHWFMESRIVAVWHGVLHHGYVKSLISKGMPFVAAWRLVEKERKLGECTEQKLTTNMSSPALANSALPDPAQICTSARRCISAFCSTRTRVFAAASALHCNVHRARALHSAVHTACCLAGPTCGLKQTSLSFL